MLKRFLYVSATLFLLVATYTIAAHRAQAQAGSMVSGVAAGVFYNNTLYVYVMTPNGDCYVRSTGSQPSGPFTGTARYLGNFWDGTVNVQSETWTGVKEKYRK